MTSVRWRTSPQGAQAALAAAFQLVGEINDTPDYELNDAIISRRDDFIAVLDEHFEFEDVDQ